MMIIINGKNKGIWFIPFDKAIDVANSLWGTEEKPKVKYDTK